MKITQTQLLVGEKEQLSNIIRAEIQSETEKTAEIFVSGNCVWSGILNQGDNCVEFCIPEPKCEAELDVVLKTDKEERATFCVKPVKHWEVHLLQWSHHDIGYTDLPSHVLESHCKWIDALIDQLDRTDMPEDVRPRAVIEQFWSLDAFLQNASEERKQKLYRHIKNGDIELTAFYGNLITEQLSHEECYRAMYRSARFAKEIGVQIETAAHNDIPGVSYGVCRALCDAGIRYFMPDFPNYFEWGPACSKTFWDESKIFNHKGPGAFWWESADGYRLLVWASRTSDGRASDGTLDALEPMLENFADDYPYDVVRMYATGGSTDNAPYTMSYALAAKAWNEKYAYPHVIMSTNKRFFEKIEFEENLPVIRGELPGTDYPLAAMSMAEVTCAARNAHAIIRAAEMLYAVANDKMLAEKDQRTDDCYHDLLLADDHAYGYHSPAGSAMRASYWEKGVRAVRAEAAADDLLSKGMASIADRIESGEETCRLVVFNFSGYEGNLTVETPMRLYDSCSHELRGEADPENAFKGAVLSTRYNTLLDESFQQGNFKLIDTKTGREVPYQLEETAWDAAETYAADRVGLGNGTNRMGLFEKPSAFKKTIRFVAEDVSPYEYRTYHLIPSEKRGETIKGAELVIQNEYYKLTATQSGIQSVLDLRDNLEMLDTTCPHGFCEILVKYANETQTTSAKVENVSVTKGDACETMEISMRHADLPRIKACIRLWKGVNQIDVAVRVLHDAKPLQTVFLAFPWVGDGIRYQAMLNDLDPVTDFMPGSQSDFLAVQDWVLAKGSDIVLSSKDTAMFSLAGLHSGYVSPAHRCVMQYEDHIPLKEEDYNNGQMYAILAANNFGTNFMCNQVFDGVYRFYISRNKNTTDHSRALFGEAMALGTKVMLTDHCRGNLKSFDSILNVGDLQCIALKKAEDGKGLVIRLWNHTESETEPLVSVFGKPCTLIRTDALENEKQQSNLLLPKAVGTYKISF